MNNAAEDLWTTNRDNTWEGWGDETHPNTGNITQRPQKAPTQAHTPARLNSDTSKTNRDTSAFVTATSFQLGKTIQTNEMTSRLRREILPLVWRN